MLTEDRYFQTLSEEELWQRYCGFLDLTVTEFMDVQKELLLDQIDRVADSVLGRKIMGDPKPRSIDEFRRRVPLTDYADYEPYLSERRTDALAVEPQLWCHSSGRGGAFKWLPHSPEYLEKVARVCVGSLILASAEQRGQIAVAPKFKILLILPPAPYVSGALFQTAAQHLSFRTIPPPETSENLEFQDRIRKGFQMTFKEGVDFIGAMASVLVSVGDQFSGQARGLKFSAAMLHPRILFRLARALIRSRRAGREMLPQDLWPVKAVFTGGVDTAIYRDDIVRYWGRVPYEVYACAESFFLAIQGWNKKGMVFLPDLVFLEFIPYEEHLKLQRDEHYRPATVLLDELEEGQTYEVVITHFYGMPLLRYRMRDLVRVTAAGDAETGVRLPQVVFQRRVGESINLGGMANLDEKTIWKAIVNTRIPCADWSAGKEYDRNQSFLRIYLELKDGAEPPETRRIAEIIDEQLQIVDLDYRDVHTYLGLKPVRVTLLSPGTFQRYINQKREEGVDLAHLKPEHINPPEAVVQRLMEMSEADVVNDKSLV